MSNEQEPHNLQLKSVDVKNMLGIREAKFSIENDCHLVIVAGENGAGKSSLVNSIFLALGGKKADIVELRKGEDEGHALLDLDSMIVKLRLKRNLAGNVVRDLVVSPKMEGQFGEQKFVAPQRKVLDNLISQFMFDPGVFLNLKASDKADALRRAFRIPVLSKDPDFKQLEDARRDAKRDLQALSARLASIPKPSDDTPDEEVSIIDLTEKLSTAQAHNQSNRERVAKVQAMKDRKAQADQDVDTYTAEVNRLNDALSAALARLATAQDMSEALDLDVAAAEGQLAELEDVDLSPIQLQISQVEETNRAVREKKQRADLRTEWDAKEALRAETEQKIESMREDVSKRTQEALTKVNLGLDIKLTDDGEVLVDGLPFENANTATQLRIALGIALTENPRLRLFRLSQGEKFTPASLAIIEEMAQQAGALILMEKPRSEEEELAQKDFKATIFLRDGEVVVPGESE